MKKKKALLALIVVAIVVSIGALGYLALSYFGSNARSSNAGGELSIDYLVSEKDVVEEDTQSDSSKNIFQWLKERLASDKAQEEVTLQTDTTAPASTQSGMSQTIRQSEEAAEEDLTPIQQAAKDAKFEVVNAAGGAYVPKADLDTKAQELTTANNTIKDLRAAAKAWDGKDPKKLEDDLKDLQTRYDTDTANIRRDAAIDLALTRAHARDPQLTRAALSMDDIKIGADGKITGLDAQIESLKKDKAWLFEEDGAGQSGKQGDKGGNPNGGQGGGYNPQSGGNPNTVNDLGSALAEVYNTNG